MVVFFFKLKEYVFLLFGGYFGKVKDSLWEKCIILNLNFEFGKIKLRSIVRGYRYENNL